MDILDPFFLLRYSAKEAILITLNNQISGHLTPDRIDVEFVESLGGNLTKAKLITVESENLSDVYYSGSSEFIYKRHNLADIFGPLYVIEDELPTTVYNVLNKIVLNNGINLDFSDFTNAVIANENFTIEVKPTSLRWFGQLNILIVDTVNKTDLSEYFNDQDLLGFSLTEKVPLSSIFNSPLTLGFSL